MSYAPQCFGQYDEDICAICPFTSGCLSLNEITLSSKLNNVKKNKKLKSANKKNKTSSKKAGKITANITKNVPKNRVKKSN